MYIADLHIHSRYSRATSRDLTLEQLDWWARQKGISLHGENKHAVRRFMGKYSTNRRIACFDDKK